MRIALVSAHTHPVALGLRYLSSYLKSMKHEVVALFMESRRDTTQPDYSPGAVADFIAAVRTCDLIGLSLLTNNYHRAMFLTREIRAAGIRAPIVWGGTHPTVAPEESLEAADAVCIGEGEEPLLQLVEALASGRDPAQTPSFWFRAGGAFGNAAEVRNRLAPLPDDLDDVPFPDWDLESQWVAGREGLVRATPANLRGALHTLRVLTTRGCPYHCTFCNNTALRKIHAGREQWVRTRSLSSVLAELRQALASFPTIHSINFVDDLFFVRTEEEIEQFAAEYNRDIRLPLELDAFPNTVNERKVAALARVPLALISMGIESASDDTLKHIYQRPTAPRRIAEAIAILDRHRVPAEYHYIVSNPYEPEQNVVETMRFIAAHHRGRAKLRVFPLMFYPGTPLYERARADGRIGTRDTVAYDFMGTGVLQFARHDYLAVWLRVVLNLRNIGVPRGVCDRLIDLVVSRPVRFVLDRRWFCPTVFVGYQIGRKLIRNFVYQPFIRPFTYLRRRPRRAAGGPPQKWAHRANRAAEKRRALFARTLPVAEARPVGTEPPVEPPAAGKRSRAEQTA